MAESDYAVDLLAFTDALLDNIATAAAEGARALAGPLSSMDESRDEATNDGALLELFSLIGDVAVDDEDDEDDMRSIAIGGKRSLSSPSASDSSGNEPSPPVARKTKKRRHHEVVRLREAAAKLQVELNTLKHRQDQAEVAARLRQNHDGDPGVWRWRRAATKEIQSTARARLENAKLKRNVNEQNAFANSLREALAKRQHSIEELQEITVPRHCADTMTTRPRDAKESSIFNRLIESAYTRICELNEGFRGANSRGPAGMNIKSSSVVPHQAAAMNEAKVLRDEEQALCIELTEGYVIPFDYNAGAHVLWTHLLSRDLMLADQNVHTEVFEATDDVILTKQTANANFLIHDHSFTTGYTVSKRACGTNCVSFLWESVTESKGAIGSSAQGTPAIQIVQKGLVKVKRVATANGSSAASLQAYVRLMPSTIGADSAETNPSEELPVRQHFDVKALTPHIVSSYRQHADSIRRFLENTLVDEMLQAAKPPQSC